MNALNKNYTTTFIYPVEYSFDRDLYVPTAKLPEEVAIQVSGQGWDLMLESLSAYGNGLKFELNNIPGSVIIKKWELEKNFNEGNHKIQLEQALSDELIVSIDEYASKEVEIIADTNSFSFKPGYQRSGRVRIIPSRVVLKGPKASINSIKDTLYIKLPEKNLSDDYDEELDLKNLIKFYNVANNAPSGVIQIAFDVSEMIPGSFNVPIKINNRNAEDTTFVLPKTSVNINCKIPEDLPVTAKEFELVVNLDSLQFKKDTFLPIEVQKVPNYVRQISLEDSVLKIDVLADTIP